MTSAGEFEALLASLNEVRPAEPREHRPLRRVAVLGAGPVGQGLACECLAAGCDVTLHTAFAPERAALAASHAVTIRGEHLVGTYRLADRSSSEPAIGLRTGIDDDVTQADAILIATPARAHATCGGLLAGRLQTDQLVVLVPGRMFGAIELARSLRRFAIAGLPTIVELAAPPYRVQAPEPGALALAGVNSDVAAAALPNRATEESVTRLRDVLPMLRPARGVLETTFSDVSGITDAPRALLREPSSVAAKIDDERRRVAFAYGVRDLEPATDDGDTPSTLQIGDPRVDDALSCSLVPLVSAGALAGIATRAAAALVDLGSVLGNLDYRRHGRTLASLGLEDFTPDDIRRALDAGEPSLLQQALA
jgi:opine dehydrogenase